VRSRPSVLSTAGIERAPLAVTKIMSKKKIVKRSKVKPFVKYVNYNHLMPTRYTVTDIDVKQLLTPEMMKKVDAKVEAKKNLKKAMEKRYLEKTKTVNAGISYFFHKLRF